MSHKNILKTAFVLLLGVAALLIPSSTHAQARSYQRLFSGTISNLVTTNINRIADVSGQQQITLSVTLQYNVTTASNRVYIPYHRRLNAPSGARETAPFGFLTLTNNGTSAYTTVTNINVGGAEQLVFPYVTNWSSDGDITNFVLGYYLKQNAP